MFSEELKTLRKLGFRHVCNTSPPSFILISDRASPCSPIASTPDPQLRFRPCVRSYDIQGSRADYEHRIADCGCPQVRRPFLSLLCSTCAERVVAPQTLPSGSMEPAFHRGDILFLVNPPNARYEIGDITVYKIPGQDIPIVHRILETHDVVKVVNGYVFTRVTLRIVTNSPSALCVVFARPSPALKTS
jgi:hypothetical protein